MKTFDRFCLWTLSHKKAPLVVFCTLYTIIKLAQAAT